MLESVEGAVRGREGVSCHLNYPLHVGSICAILNCVCECECECGYTSLVEPGAAVGDTPPTPPLLCIKQIGGRGIFVTLLTDTGTNPTHWTLRLFGHTHSSGTYWLSWEKEHFSVFGRLDSPGGGSETEKRERHHTEHHHRYHHHHHQDSPYFGVKVSINLAPLEVNCYSAMRIFNLLYLLLLVIAALAPLSSAKPGKHL